MTSYIMAASHTPFSASCTWCDDERNTTEDFLRNHAPYEDVTPQDVAAFFGTVIPNPFKEILAHLEATRREAYWGEMEWIDPEYEELPSSATHHALDDSDGGSDLDTASDCYGYDGGESVGGGGNGRDPHATAAAAAAAGATPGGPSKAAAPLPVHEDAGDYLFKNKFGYI